MDSQCNESGQFRTSYIDRYYMRCSSKVICFGQTLRSILLTYSDISQTTSGFKVPPSEHCPSGCSWRLSAVLMSDAHAVSRRRSFSRLRLLASGWRESTTVLPTSPPSFLLSPLHMQARAKEGRTEQAHQPSINHRQQHNMKWRLTTEERMKT